MLQFIDNVLSVQTWIRVFYVLLGMMLVYFALTMETGRFNLWYGK